MTRDSDPRALIEAGRQHDEAMTEAPWRPCGAGASCPCRLVWSIPADVAVCRAQLDDEPGRLEDVDGIAWLRTNLRALLNGYAAALDEAERLRWPSCTGAAVPWPDRFDVESARALAKNAAEEPPDRALLDSAIVEIRWACDEVGSLRSENEQLRTLVQALRFDTDERARLSRCLAVTQEQLDKFMSACADQTIQIMELRGEIMQFRAAAKEGESKIETGAPSIDDLVAGTEPFTLADFQRERAELERRFLTEHGTHAEDIGAAIRRGVLPCTDPLVEDWVGLWALAPYVGFDR